MHYRSPFVLTSPVTVLLSVLCVIVLANPDLKELWEPFADLQSVDHLKEVLRSESRRDSARLHVTHGLDGESTLQYDAELLPNVFPLDAEDSLINVRCYSSLGKSGEEFLAVITCSDPDICMQSWQPGAILSGSYRTGCSSLDSNRKHPFIGKVISIEKEEISGNLLVRMQRVRAGDCFRHIHIRFDHHPSSADIGRRAQTSSSGCLGFNYDCSTSSIENQTIPIVDSSAVQLNCLNCYGTLSYDFHFQMDAGLTWYLSPYLDLSTSFEGDLTILGELDLIANYHTMKSVRTGTLTGPTIPAFGLVVYGIGFGITITPKIYLGADLELEMVGNASVGFSLDQSVNIGITYSDGFEPIYESAINSSIGKPQVYFVGNAELTVYLAPSIDLELSSGIEAEFLFLLKPYVGVDVIWNSANCPSSADPYYQTFYGANGTIQWTSLDFSIIDVSSLISLPWIENFVILSETNFSCSDCSGCFDIYSEYVSPGSYWYISPWSSCSASCDGTQTRTVQCYNSLGSVSDTNCSNIPQPSNSRSCNSVCDCDQYANCESCLSSSQCSWCASDSICVSLNSTDCNILSNNSCSAFGLLEILTPNSMSFWNTSEDRLFNITWNSLVPFNGTVSFYLYFEEEWLQGAGLPIDPIPNSGSYLWSIPPFLPTFSTYRIAISGTNNPNFYSISSNFTIENVPITGSYYYNYYWVMGQWSNCSSSCGGTQNRSVDCYDYLENIVNYTYCTLPVPVDVSECSSPCIDYPISLLSPQVGSLAYAGSVLNVTWVGGLQNGMVYVGAFYFNFSVDEWIPLDSYSIDNSAIPNYYYYLWNIPSNISSAFYVFCVGSYENFSNFDCVDYFTIIGTAYYTVYIQTSAHQTAAINANISIMFSGIYENLLISLIDGMLEPNNNETYIGLEQDIGYLVSIELRLEDPSLVWYGELVAVENNVEGFLGWFGVQEPVTYENSFVQYNCYTPNSCNWCTSMTSCGWCADNDVCYPGNSNGPLIYNCSNWNFDLSSCFATSSTTSTLTTTGAPVSTSNTFTTSNTHTTANTYTTSNTFTTSNPYTTSNTHTIDMIRPLLFIVIVLTFLCSICF